MRFRLIESEGEFYDYGTSDVTDEVLFDVNKAEASYYNGILHDSDYYKTHKNKQGKIVWMTPQKYYETCADDIFNVPLSSLKSSRSYDVKTNEFLKRVILEQKKKFPIAVIDYTSKGQEGLHRMQVAGELVGWDVKQPVLIIDWFDKELHKQSEERKRVYEIQRRIENAVKKSLHYTYSNIEEFKEQLVWDLNDEFNISYNEPDIEFDFLTKGDKCVVTVKDVEYEFDMSDIKIDNSIRDNDSLYDLDDIDLDDIDFSDEEQKWIDNLLKKS